MLGLALDGVDARDLPLALFPDLFRGRLRDHAERRLGVAGMRLDLEPDAELLLRLPDGGHFGAGVTRDHGGLVGTGGKTGNGGKVAADLALTDRKSTRLNSSH